MILPEICKIWVRREGKEGGGEKGREKVKGGKMREG